MSAKTILYVEDNEVNRRLVQDLLIPTTYRLIEATDGEAGVAMARKERPDLILMDVQLPGQDGLTLTRLLKSAPATSAIPVVALTAHAMTGDRELALAAGCIAYISKPIDTRTFGVQVRKFLSAAVDDDRRAVAQ